MRTEEQFYRVWREVKRYHDLHNKPIWIVPLKDDYRISIIKPLANELPENTVSILFGLNMEELDSVAANNTKSSWQLKR